MHPAGHEWQRSARSGQLGQAGKGRLDQYRDLSSNILTIMAPRLFWGYSLQNRVIEA